MEGIHDGVSALRANAQSVGKRELLLRECLFGQRGRMWRLRTRVWLSPKRVLRPRERVCLPRERVMRPRERVCLPRERL